MSFEPKGTNQLGSEEKRQKSKSVELKPGGFQNTSTSIERKSAPETEMKLKEGVALANRYKYGLGVQKNLQVAFHIFKCTADLGSIDGLYELGMCYFNGEGVEQDLTKAQKLFKQAADQGHPLAQGMIEKSNQNLLKSSTATVISSLQSHMSEKKTHTRTPPNEDSDNIETGIDIKNIKGHDVSQLDHDPERPLTPGW